MPPWWKVDVHDAHLLVVSCVYGKSEKIKLTLVENRKKAQVLSIQRFGCTLEGLVVPVLTLRRKGSRLLITVDGCFQGEILPSRSCTMCYKVVCWGKSGGREEGERVDGIISLAEKLISILYKNKVKGQRGAQTFVQNYFYIEDETDHSSRR